MVGGEVLGQHDIVQAGYIGLSAQMSEDHSSRRVDPSAHLTHLVHAEMFGACALVVATVDNQHIAALGQLENLNVEGLMALPPYFEQTEEVRPYFRRLRELSERARQRGLLRGAELSMGMSHDFEVAIEEGATMIRVGTALFGPRPSLATTPIGETT